MERMPSTNSRKNKTLQETFEKTHRGRCKQTACSACTATDLHESSCDPCLAWAVFFPIHLLVICGGRQGCRVMERERERRGKKKKILQTSNWFRSVPEPAVTGVLLAFHMELVKGSRPSKRNLGARGQTQTTQQHHTQQKLTLREHCRVGGWGEGGI